MWEATGAINMYVIRNVECLECSYIWTAIFPYNIDVISNLECPCCHRQNSMILVLDDIENNKFLS